jgi:hypothetical protein
MLFGNIVKLAHMALGLVPKILNSINVILLVGNQFGMVDPEVLEVKHIQCVVFASSLNKQCCQARLCSQ